MPQSEHPPYSSQFDMFAGDVAAELSRTGRQLVLAESCTAGLIAARLGRIPGVSHWFCGSAVVYQEPTKSAWLGVQPDTLARHGAVSKETAIEMVGGVLAATPHADVAASITGHLGPGAPPELDGIAWIAIAFRGEPPFARRVELTPAPGLAAAAIRNWRQVAAAATVLKMLAHDLHQRPDLSDQEIHT